MSRLQSYNENNLVNKISSLEQELIQMKAKQIYGMDSAQVYTSNEVSRASHTFTMIQGSSTFVGSATNILRVRFTGNKPSKIVVGKLNYTLDVTTAGDYCGMRYLKQYRGSSPNVLEWLLCASGGNNALGGTYSVFNLKLSAITNEIGVLSIVEGYAIDNYYDWVFG